METTVVSERQLINDLLKIGHGDLSIYNKIGQKAVKHDPELFAHLIAWNHKKGQVRDSKKAFPVLALHGNGIPVTENWFEYSQNAMAHLCMLDTRDLLAAWRYHKTFPVNGSGASSRMTEAITHFIKIREKKRSWWTATALQHRKTLKALYALNHIKPNKYANDILFKKQYPTDSVFAKLANLKNMSSLEAAGTIINHKIPFLVASTAVGGFKDKKDIVMALMESMTLAELVNNTNMLTKMGVFDDSVLKVAYNKVVNSAKKAKKTNALKAGRAAAATTNIKAKKSLEKIEESQLSKAGGIEGHWLILADRSYSMHSSIGLAQNVAALIAHRIKGKVYLIFFNESPRFYDVTGKTLQEIKKQTASMTANGATGIGCGLEYIMHKKFLVNGIVICSDGGENRAPLFATAYKNYIKQMNIEPTVYHFHVPGDPNRLKVNLEHYIQYEEFELGDNVDYYALPNLINVMKTNRYSLIDEILETPLLTLDTIKTY